MGDCAKTKMPDETKNKSNAKAQGKGQPDLCGLSRRVEMNIIELGEYETSNVTTCTKSSIITIFSCWFRIIPAKS